MICTLHQYCWGDKIEKNEIGGACNACGGKGEAYTGFLVGKPGEKRPHGRSKRRWKDNIKMYLQEVGCGGMDWIELAQDTSRWRALVNTVMNLWVP